jgi:hypothetical protein
MCFIPIVWNTDADFGLFHLSDLELELMVGVTGRQGMGTSPGHVIYSVVCETNTIPILMHQMRISTT